VGVEIEKGRNPRECIYRWHRDSTAPELHVAFTHIELPGGTGGTDASPFQGGVKARGKGASQAAVLITTLKMLDSLSALIHLV
jgi:hypothetical protein